LPLEISDEDVIRMAAKLAALTGLTETEAIKRALQNELRPFDNTLPLRERIRPIQERIAAYPPTGLPADKAFFDELSGDM
jgi:antitoxin VapB